MFLDLGDVVSACCWARRGSWVVVWLPPRRSLRRWHGRGSNPSRHSRGPGRNLSTGNFQGRPAGGCEDDQPAASRAGSISSLRVFASLILRKETFRMDCASPSKKGKENVTLKMIRLRRREVKLRRSAFVALSKFARIELDRR